MTRRTAAFTPDSDPPPPPPPSGSGASKRKRGQLLRISDRYEIDPNEVACVEHTPAGVEVHLRSGLVCAVETACGEFPWDVHRRIVALINEGRAG